MNDDKDLQSLDDRLLWDIWESRHDFSSLVVAFETGIFAALAKTPRSADEIASELNLNQRGTAALMALLKELGLLRKEADKYALTLVSQQYLSPESQLSWGGVLHRFLESPSVHRFIELLKSPDRDPTQHKRMTDAWKGGGFDEKSARVVLPVMHTITYSSAIRYSGQFELRGAKRVLDMAGGSGCFSIALAQQFPKLSCTVAELPAVTPVTREYLEKYQVTDRVSTVGLDMFNDEWPKGFDVVVFSNIFHDYNDEDCRKLAEKAFRSLNPGGRILLHEILAEENAKVAASYSVSMFLLTEGKQYSFEEFSEILSSAGFSKITSEKSLSYYSVVSGIRP